MNSKIIISFCVFIIVSASFSISDAVPTCPENQEWNSCGSACPKTCNSDTIQVCTMQCIIGCQCKQGYVLSSTGQCILPANC